MPPLREAGSPPPRHWRASAPSCHHPPRPSDLRIAPQVSFHRHSQQPPNVPVLSSPHLPALPLLVAAGSRTKESSWKGLAARSTAEKQFSQLKEFLLRTGLEYTPKQVRNKWTKLKREYNTFKKLKLRETGGGWDFEKNTIKQDNKWWKKAKVDLPGCGKFKKHGLRNEEGLCILFEDISVDGTDHWNPASGLPPPSSSALKTALNVDEITDLDLEDDIKEQHSPSVASSSKVRLGVTIPEKNKKPKTAQVMQEEIRKISSIAHASHISFQSFLKKDETVYVASTMDLVRDCGAIDGTDEHFIATELFLKR
ncbi:uncharacterized protein LOC119320703 [Triticum dicoccoides]|uniref:uncharacterized protein LOC119320703 n=1 Tax=Triticum dicoccoides TaxID=85692 RepID=UPI0018919A97|nr:uncharacterized protein LOC119320703 [Triticum dicoccoides]